MDVIPKLDITAATRYVDRSDFFLAILSFKRTAEICCCSISSSSGFSTVGWSCDLSEVRKQMVRVRALSERILAGRRWFGGEKRRKQLPAAVLGFGPRKGFRPVQLIFAVAAAEIPAAMAPFRPQKQEQWRESVSVAAARERVGEGERGFLLEDCMALGENH
ncbi:hypothetical protein AAC387_Pa08g0858 [Persea americana]